MTKKHNPRQKFIETVTLDASGKPLGRLASEIARYLQGKHRPDYTPQLDRPIAVTVTNVVKLKITGQKLEQKIYHRYSGYPGGLKKVSLGQRFQTNPGNVLRKAVFNMLPPNRLRQRRFNRLIIS